MGALDGLRVLDFGQYMAGPMAAMFLGDQGADVIRIDPPGGAFCKTPANATWNRNKRSIVLDLKQDKDRGIALRLVGSADVLIENFRPDVMDRLGLGADAVMPSNPHLIYCSLPGFGADDPRAGMQAWEGILGAATGAFRVESSASARPVYTVIPFSSATGAYLAALSIAMAVYARERTGRGQRVEVPLFDATFTAIGARGLIVHRFPEKFPPFNWMTQFPTRDGRWLMYVPGNKQFQAFLEGIGVADDIEAGVAPEVLARKVDAIFRSRTAAEWEAWCESIGTEGMPCLTSAEWLQHPHALASGIVAEYDDPELGRFRGPGVTPGLSVTPGSVRRPRPALDAHHNEILRELDAPRPAATPRADTEENILCALQGVKVLDLCIIVAGSTCGRALGEFGADVIKIDSTTRNPIMRHNEVNRAKRSILLDLKTEAGLEIFWKLLEDADVVLQNFRKGVAERLGVGYEAVRARRPGIVYCSMNTFGQRGPFVGRPGHELIAQAATGMQVRYGDEKPAGAPFSANDYGTGLLGAYAVALALLHRRRTGEGQHVNSALAFTATMLQSGLMQAYADRQWNEPHGQDAQGVGPLHRIYEAQDGWLFLAARPGELTACAALAGLAAKSGAELEDELQARFATRPVAAWIEALSGSGIAAHRVVTDMAELMNDPIVRRRGLSVTRIHDEIGLVTTPGPGQRLSLTPAVVGRPAPKPGSDAATILAEAGLLPRMDELIAGKVIAIDGIGTV